MLDPVTDDNALALIEGAVMSYHEKTCIRWVPADATHRHRVLFTNGQG